VKLLDKYSTIFFDLYFTLVLPVYFDDEAKNEYYMLGIDKTTWIKIADELYNERATGKINDPIQMIENMAHSINPGISKDRIAQATEARIKRYKDCIKNIDQKILNTIKFLKEHGKILGLISNSDVIDKIGWIDSALSYNFDVSIFSCDIGILKPDKLIYEAALKIIKKNPIDCLFIGDGGHDELKGAKESGMTTILTTNIIKSLWPEKIENIKKHADYVIDNINDLLEL
jgi:putative hydrolase of the HAD superfamily